jgi:hypothetical protein
MGVPLRRTARLTLRMGGAAALMLALMALGVAASPGNAGAPQDDAKPVKAKDDASKKQPPSSWAFKYQAKSSRGAP